MTINYTPYSQLPYPLVDEFIKDINDHIRHLAQKVDDMVVMRFASQSALAAITAPVGGQVAYITADKVLQIYDGTAWRRVYPTSPQIFSGTTTPAQTLGAVGDLYVQYG